MDSDNKKLFVLLHIIPYYYLIKKFNSDAFLELQDFLINHLKLYGAKYNTIFDEITDKPLLHADISNKLNELIKTYKLESVSFKLKEKLNYGCINYQTIITFIDNIFNECTNAKKDESIKIYLSEEEKVRLNTIHNIGINLNILYNSDETLAIYFCVICGVEIDNETTQSKKFMKSVANCIEYWEFDRLQKLEYLLCLKRT
jgi:hypothetical protein